MRLKKSFIEHLEELRKRIIYILIFYALSSVLCYFFSTRIFLFLVPHGINLHFFSPLEPFLARVYVSLFAGMIITLPFFFFHLFSFINPAFFDREKNYIYISVISSFFAFIIGAYLGHRFLLPIAVRVLFAFGENIAIETVGINNFLKFLMFLTLASGLMMEIPVIIFHLTRSGLLNASMLLSKWRYAVIIILIFAAFITPTVDPFTLLLISVPITGLYFLSIFLARIAESRKSNVINNP